MFYRQSNQILMNKTKFFFFPKVSHYKKIKNGGEGVAIRKRLKTTAIAHQPVLRFSHERHPVGAHDGRIVRDNRVSGRARYPRT
jgi:hypothetical protein